ncbi:MULTISPECIES: hypothetical protein [Idiomarina]|uniref:Acetyltransferase, GNAT family n=1 Tax=Idiomarina loihiensis (strain ATCC BAA-735 / DSM 15497 / L2-TR) TaxID=283942 RepID=Q5R098_IDILO|nr:MULTISPECIES: hypothetical protein [Idiomarina]MAC35051.1 acetyltransferase [Haliea sp.]AAV81491.1 Acetyltransferase, GNAT family [Idiomarina loihiensis L2TR]AGM35518.1 acetyltransferase [Idiomarina loihiensis GSL 199]MAO68184.1 acetyltransferase [Idiomarina sp.]MBF79936.1 acetyltransferase [Idiomarina sp.]
MNQLFSDFSCPPQHDVKRFLTNSAIRFEREDKARSYLILDDDNGDLLGYFSITFKEITYPSEAVSNTANKRLGAVTDAEVDDKVRVRAYLIGQLAKNKAIEGNQINLEIILSEIYGVINEARELIGGRAVILECAQDDNLVALYERHGFKKIEMPPNHNGDITMYIVIRD